MRQPETGSRQDLIEHRFRIAMEDLETARLLLHAEQYRVPITEHIMQFIIRLMRFFRLRKLRSSDIRTHWHILINIILRRKSFRVIWEEEL